MIQFIYTGDANISMDEIEASKQAFIDKLGDFKEEFEEKNGIATINFGVPVDDENRVHFVLDNKYSLPDFIQRWNQYIRSRQ
jgi:hypothetical protein